MQRLTLSTIYGVVHVRVVATPYVRRLNESAVFSTSTTTSSTTATCKRLITAIFLESGGMLGEVGLFLLALAVANVNTASATIDERSF